MMELTLPCSATQHTITFRRGVRPFALQVRIATAGGAYLASLGDGEYSAFRKYLHGSRSPNGNLDLHLRCKPAPGSVADYLGVRRLAGSGGTGSGMRFEVLDKMWLPYGAGDLTAADCRELKSFLTRVVTAETGREMPPVFGL